MADKFGFTNGPSNSRPRLSNLPRSKTPQTPLEPITEEKTPTDGTSATLTASKDPTTPSGSSCALATSVVTDGVTPQPRPAAFPRFEQFSSSLSFADSCDVDRQRPLKSSVLEVPTTPQPSVVTPVSGGGTGLESTATPVPAVSVPATSAPAADVKSTKQRASCRPIWPAKLVHGIEVRQSNTDCLLPVTGWQSMSGMCLCQTPHTRAVDRHEFFVYQISLSVMWCQYLSNVLRREVIFSILDKGKFQVQNCFVHWLSSYYRTCITHRMLSG
jgi:hypothetical protein